MGVGHVSVSRTAKLDIARRWQAYYGTSQRERKQWIGTRQQVLRTA